MVSDEIHQYFSTNPTLLLMHNIQNETVIISDNPVMVFQEFDTLLLLWS